MMVEAIEGYDGERGCLEGGCRVMRHSKGSEESHVSRDIALRR